MTFNYIRVTIKLQERILGTAFFEPKTDNLYTYERKAESLSKLYLPSDQRTARHSYSVEKISSAVVRMTETFFPKVA